MKTDCTLYTCDTCQKKVVENKDNPRIGGHVAHGWFHLKRVSGSTSLDDLKQPREWNFCSLVCLRNFAMTGVVQ